MRTRILYLTAASLALAACRDAAGPGLVTLVDKLHESEAKASFVSYVAIGTSISMGIQSDGLTAASQATAWPAQLAHLGGFDMALPLIEGTGCRAPLAAPLGSGRRTSGESAAAPTGTLLCGALKSGVTLPTRNVAMSAARTSDALGTTPEMVQDPFYAKLYPRILPPGKTQVTAMEALRPTFVSVELGANEVLGATSGVAIVGASIVPVESWKPVYRQVMDRVHAVANRAVVAGLIHV